MDNALLAGERHGAGSIGLTFRIVIRPEMSFNTKRKKLLLPKLPFRITAAYIKGGSSESIMFLE